VDTSWRYGPVKDDEDVKEQEKIYMLKASKKNNKTLIFKKDGKYESIVDN
jgi:hypothetical protein